MGNGYFPPPTRRSRSTPRPPGIPNTTNPNDPLGSSGRFNTMYTGLRTLDDPLRVNSPYGKPLDDYDSFYRRPRA